METSQPQQNVIIPVNNANTIPSEQLQQQPFSSAEKPTSDFRLNQDNINPYPSTDIKTDINKNEDIPNNYIQNTKDVQISPSKIDYDKAIYLSIRSKFMLKVFGILIFQLLITFGFIFIAQIGKVKVYFLNHTAVSLTLFGIAIFVYIVCFILFICNPNFTKKVPINYIILFLITLSMTIILVFISIQYSFQIILSATTFLIAICLSMFCLALFNKIDAKYLMLIIFGFLFLGIAYALLAAIFRSFYLLFLYCMIVAILYVLFIAYDTILIRDNFDIDEYIFAAMTLYFDIIRLLLFILQMLGGSKK